MVSKIMKFKTFLNNLININYFKNHHNLIQLWPNKISILVSYRMIWLFHQQNTTVIDQYSLMLKYKYLRLFSKAKFFVINYVFFFIYLCLNLNKKNRLKRD